MSVKSAATCLMVSVVTVGLLVAVAFSVSGGKPVLGLAPMSDGDIAARGMADCNYHRCPKACYTDSGSDFAECNNHIVDCTGGTQFCWGSGESLVCQRYILHKGPLYSCMPSTNASDLAGHCGVVVNDLLCKTETTCECSGWWEDECNCGPYINDIELAVLEGCE